MKKITIILCLTFLVTGLWGETTNGKCGAFLAMPIGWKQIAMGGTGVAVGGEINSGVYNPAGLQAIDGYGLSSGYTKMVLDRWLYNISGAWNLNDDAAVGLNWIHNDVENIPGRDISGNYTGELDFGENMISLTFSKFFHDEFTFGGNVKYVQARLSEITTYTAGFDVGVHSRLMNDKIRLGGVYKNIAMTYQWDSDPIYGSEDGSATDEEIPSSFIVGVAYLPDFKKTQVTMEIEYTEYNDIYLRGGASIMPINNVTFALGYDDGLFSTGLGYRYDTGFGAFELGYSLRLEREGLPPRHTFDLNFNRK